MITITLDEKYYARISNFPWLANCGNLARPTFDLPVQWVANRLDALETMFSCKWADTNTHAAGCLTGYLARLNYDSYGNQWGKLFKKSSLVLEEQVIPRVMESLILGGWAASMSETRMPEVTPELQASLGKQTVEDIVAKEWIRSLSLRLKAHMNLGALELAFRQKFRRAPRFFEVLMTVYEAGHLPCGWEGDLDHWPAGKLLVY